MKRPAKRGSACLGKLKNTYRLLEDVHLPLFKEVQKMARAKRVLYPGCHWHLQASLVFPHVTYVDYNPQVAPFFEDPTVQAWLEEHKIYSETPQLTFQQLNFEHLRLPPKSFDLLISMSAGVLALKGLFYNLGIVSKPCAKFLKAWGSRLAWNRVGGWLLPGLGRALRCA